MQILRLLSAALALVFSILGLSAPASAQNNRSWVSGTGLDTNSCLRSAPCLTLAGAYGKTNIGGEINCADPGTYSSLTIGHSITIDCAEGFGLTNGIIINIPVGTMNDPARAVRLRGLDLGGFASEPGIEIIAAASVVLDSIRVSHFSQQGIFDHRTGGGNLLSITDSTISNNAGAGIVIASGAVSGAVLDNVRSIKNAFGLATGAGNNVTINRSLFSGNSGAGIEGDFGSQIVVNNSIINYNNIGIQSSSAARLSNNDIAFNNIAISGNSGTFGNNRFSGNASIGTAPTPLGGASSDLAQQ